MNVCTDACIHVQCTNGHRASSNLPQAMNYLILRDLYQNHSIQDVQLLTERAKKQLSLRRVHSATYPSTPELKGIHGKVSMTKWCCSCYKILLEQAWTKSLGSWWAVCNDCCLQHNGSCDQRKLKFLLKLTNWRMGFDYHVTEITIFVSSFCWVCSQVKSGWASW